MTNPKNRKDFWSKIAEKRWDLGYSKDSGLMTKFIAPEMVSLSGDFDSQMKQLKLGGLDSIEIEELSETIRETPEVRRIKFIISDASVDRHGDTASMDGWVLKYYQDTVLWGHSHSTLPVAKSLKIWKHGGKLKSLAEFTPKELNPHGWAVGELSSEGFIKSCSVGFIPLDGEVNEERTGDSWWPSMDFTEQELIEWSVCNVGSNRNALTESKFYAEGQEILEDLGTESEAKVVNSLYASRPMSDEELKEFTLSAMKALEI